MPSSRPLPTDRPVRIAVLDDYMGVAPELADWASLAPRAEVQFFHEPIVRDDLTATLGPFDAICLLRERTDFPADVLKKLPNLKAIAATGKSNRTLDGDAATRLGIVVMMTESSGNGAFATVELAWGLILGLMRHIPAESAAMRDGGWQRHLGSALYGRTIGLVGLGRLGSRMALVAQAFGMDVIAWSPNLTEARAAAAGARAVTKEEVFRQANIVSLHLVLGPSTRGIVGQAELSWMKSDALLINTSRGPLIDQTSLLQALHAGQIGGVGIDVFDHEPLPADAIIRAAPNALLTPHLGYCVRETLEAFYQQTVENLLAWLNGKPIRLIEA